MSQRIVDFIAYLNAKVQLGSVYVLGAQNDIIEFSTGKVTRNGKLIHNNYVAWVKKREPEVKDATAALNFIAARKEAGYKTVPCFDCSGLGVAYFTDQKGWFDSDMSADGLYGKCSKITRSALKVGDLVFRHNGTKAHHVGYVTAISGTSITVVEAMGRSYGVVSRDISASGSSYWNKYGRLAVLQETDPEPEPKPFVATCSGASVNVRKGPGTSHAIVGVAHKGDLMLALPPAPGTSWHEIVMFLKGNPLNGYMSGTYVKEKT